MTDNDHGTARTLADLIFQLGRATHDYVEGLSPAQWSVLRYLQRANHASRTVSAFAEYHATTRGTASQTVKSLVNEGYVRKTRSPEDGRSSVLDLTPTGLEMLRHDPCTSLVRAAEELPPGIRAQTIKGLKRLLASLEMKHVAKPFGTCADCAYLETIEKRGVERARAPDSKPMCALKRRVLEDHELEQVCVDFSSIAAWGK